MLQGRFDYSRKGRPYVDAITLFPRFKRARRVSFLVDTGADNTTISPIDALLLGVRYAELDLRRARPGRDILDRWEMTYCPTAGRLAFEVLSADDQLASP